MALLGRITLYSVCFCLLLGGGETIDPAHPLNFPQPSTLQLRTVPYKSTPQPNGCSPYCIPVLRIPALVCNTAPPTLHCTIRCGTSSLLTLTLTLALTLALALFRNILYCNSPPLSFRHHHPFPHPVRIHSRRNKWGTVDHQPHSLPRFLRLPPSSPSLLPLYLPLGCIFTASLLLMTRIAPRITSKSPRPGVCEPS
jgi:hypothetical protein